MVLRDAGTVSSMATPRTGETAHAGWPRSVLLGHRVLPYLAVDPSAVHRRYCGALHRHQGAWALGAVEVSQGAAALVRYARPTTCDGCPGRGAGTTAGVLPYSWPNSPRLHPWCKMFTSTRGAHHAAFVQGMGDGLILPRQGGRPPCVSIMVDACRWCVRKGAGVTALGSLCSWGKMPRRMGMTGQNAPHRDSRGASGCTTRRKGCAPAAHARGVESP
jgi:hypothetical protein